MLFKVMFWILSGTVIVISREPYIVRFKTVLTFYMLLYEWVVLVCWAEIVYFKLWFFYESDLRNAHLCLRENGKN